MTVGAENRLVKLRDELQSIKQAPTLGYPKTLKPENTPERSQSATITHRGSASGVMAEWRARYTRTDGINKPPLVDFPYSVSFSPTYASYQRDVLGHSGADNSGYVERQCYDGFVSGSGQDYIDFSIVINNRLVDYYAYPEPTEDEPNPEPVEVRVNVIVQAVATVPGTLTLERAR